MKASRFTIVRKESKCYRRMTRLGSRQKKKNCSEQKAFKDSEKLCCKAGNTKTFFAAVYVQRVSGGIAVTKVVALPCCAFVVLSTRT